jgi:hypothetical protein
MLAHMSFEDESLQKDSLSLSHSPLCAAFAIEVVHGAYVKKIAVCGIARLMPPPFIKARELEKSLHFSLSPSLSCLKRVHVMKNFLFRLLPF